MIVVLFSGESVPQSYPSHDVTMIFLFLFGAIKSKVCSTIAEFNQVIRLHLNF